MKKLLPFILALALVLTGCGAAVTAEPTPTVSAAPDYSFDSESFPTLAGGVSAEPLAQAVASVMLGRGRGDVGAYLSFGNTGAAYDALAAGECGMLIAIDNGSLGAGYDVADIALDALVFYVSANNPVTELTSAQLRSIYTGKITNWSEVGGRDEEILAFQRYDWSATQSALEELVLGGASPAEPVYDYIRMSDGTAAKSVAVFDGSDGAIGFTTLYEAESMGLADGYRILRVDGADATAETVSGGEYPFVLTYIAAISADAASDSPERVLWEWLQDGSGAAFIAAQGYVR